MSLIPLEPMSLIIGTAPLSLLAIGAFRMIANSPIPDPNSAGAWSFYGVLIVAIMVLFAVLIAIIRWVATTWLRKQEEMQDKSLSQSRELHLVSMQTIRDNTVAAQAVATALDRQNEFFDSVLQDTMKETLKVAQQTK